LAAASSAVLVRCLVDRTFVDLLTNLLACRMQTSQSAVQTVDSSSHLSSVIKILGGSYPCWRQFPWLWRHRWRHWWRFTSWRHVC